VSAAVVDKSGAESKRTLAAMEANGASLLVAVMVICSRMDAGNKTTSIAGPMFSSVSNCEKTAKPGASMINLSPAIAFEKLKLPSSEVVV
jgi:hypothetical protein